MESGSNLKQFQKVILLQGAVTLTVFALISCAVLFFFRAEIRKQILQRDGILLTEVAQYFHDRGSEMDDEYELLDVAFESSELERVIGVGLYSSDGQNEATIPVDLNYSNLSEDTLGKLQSDSPVIEFYPNISLAYLFTDIDALIDDQTYPVTEVIAPISDRNGNIVAIIQYWLDSESVATELAHLDDFLILIGIAFVTGGGVLFYLVFLVSRKRLMKMGVLLAEQNQSLKKANADLAMAARTSAIGTVSSHLFHGLKNPLAGLKAYLKLSGHDDEVLEITDRMQQLIDESLSVIHDQSDLQNQTLSMTELVELVHTRLNITSNQRVRIDHSGEGEIPAYKIQLLLLVIRNLLENALEASADSSVTLDFSLTGNVLTTTVKDTGPGLPEAVKEQIFNPVRSAKKQGTGIGLAISSEISRHIPSTLRLAKSDSAGTVFINDLPL